MKLKLCKKCLKHQLDGEAYDMDRFGQYFRPAGMAARTGDPQKERVHQHRHQRHQQQLQHQSNVAPVAAPAPVADLRHLKRHLAAEGHRAKHKTF